MSEHQVRDSTSLFRKTCRSREATSPTRSSQRQSKYRTAGVMVYGGYDGMTDQTTGVQTNAELDGRGSIPGRGSFFIFATASIPVLKPTHLYYPVATGSFLPRHTAAGTWNL